MTAVESDFYRRKSFDFLRENEEFVKLELTQAAQKLAEEAQLLIRVKDKRKKRKPPCVLVTRTSGSGWGPQVVWIRYSTKTFKFSNGDQKRLTQVIPRGQSLRYPNAIFKGYEPELRLELQKIEERAAAIRRDIRFWSEVFRTAKKADEQGIAR
ncbi:conjugative transfer protein MobI(A/C) [Paenirhodobacter populi]|uniref:conjugative transfer protein MobI(A/C) n=1 Tax=Paenirhodobacter populi TaxID=2306993 RepID=UPI0013E2AD23|nr:conjugative transfer protein MobI(A/C) [Sinirhodobacter populi]